ncbi:hypothetical protein [Parasphingorhabdus sp.]|uniref:hypothetical protein n=1 Tax=Parasphingorhabdus sp. TaxID=2709688 RepID=UPI002F94AFFC
MALFNHNVGVYIIYKPTTSQIGSSLILSRMDSRLLLGLGVSFVFGFVRWRFPAVPKHFATFGSVLGMGLLVWAAFPAFDWRWAVVLITVAAVTAALLDAMLVSTTKTADPPTTAPTIDQQVTSQAQSGGITARNVRVDNVDK